MRQRGGGTLLLVLLLTIVLAALSAAVAARAITHAEAARAREGADAARANADAGVVDAWQGWDGADRAADSIGTITRLIVPGRSSVAEVRIARVSSRLWWIASEAWAAGGLAMRPVSRATGFAVWLAVGAPVPSAAIVGAGVVTADSAARILGIPTSPAGWRCPSSPAIDALRLATPGLLQAPPGVVVGTVQGPAAAGPDEPSLWDAEWAGIAARADVLLASDTTLAPAPGLDPATCSVGWGEPSRADSTAPCHRRFAVVHAPQGLTLRGGRGQGVLLVHGTLTLEAGAEFGGLVVVRGPLRLRGGARVVGAVVLLPDTGASPTASLADSSAIWASPCAVAGALLGGTLVREVPRQGWFGLW